MADPPIAMAGALVEKRPRTVNSRGVLWYTPPTHRRGGGGCIYVGPAPAQSGLGQEAPSPRSPALMPLPATADDPAPHRARARSPPPHSATVSNPAFSREDPALDAFMRHTRVVFGADCPEPEAIMRDLSRPLCLIGTRFLFTDIATAEMIKYTSNAFLATKVSFINEVANLCERVGADVQVVAKAMGLDHRIGSKFLHAGPGYGGSWFPQNKAAVVQNAPPPGA